MKRKQKNNFNMCRTTNHNKICSYHSIFRTTHWLRASGHKTHYAIGLYGRFIKCNVICTLGWELQVCYVTKFWQNKWKMKKKIEKMWPIFNGLPLPLSPTVIILGSATVDDWSRNDDCSVGIFFRMSIVFPIVCGNKSELAFEKSKQISRNGQIDSYRINANNMVHLILNGLQYLAQPIGIRRCFW